MAGLGFTFGFNGRMSLQDNDRRGATFSAPEIRRWTGYTLEVIDN